MYFTGGKRIITISGLIFNYSYKWDLHDLGTLKKADFHYWSDKLPSLYASDPEDN